VYFAKYSSAVYNSIQFQAYFEKLLALLISNQAHSQPSKEMLVAELNDHHGLLDGSKILSTS
jgi:hypothetical protein